MKYFDRYKDWLKRAAQAGNLRAMGYLAEAMRVSPFDTHPNVSFGLAEKAAKSGVSESLFRLASFYQEGWGCDADQDQAETLFRQSLLAAKREDDASRVDAIRQVLQEKDHDKRIQVILKVNHWSSIADLKKLTNDMEEAGSGPSSDELQRLSKDARAARRASDRAKSNGRPSAPDAKLRLIDTAWSVSSTGNYVTVQGRITNISIESLENIQVTVTFEDAQGGLVTTSKAVVSPNPLQPGELGTFEVIERTNARFDHYRTAFSQILGGSIPTVGIR
jgi:hypothetical protein